MTKLDPVEIAIDMLKLELPAFETRFSAGRDSIAIHGALPIGAGMSAEAVLYPMQRQRVVFVSGEQDFKPAIPITETPEARALRLAEEREKIEDDVRPGVEEIARRIRNFAIEAVNLRPQIDRDIERGREAGRAEGYARGYTLGREHGRSAMAAEIVDGLIELRGMIPGE